MKIVLLHDVENIGMAGQVLNVSDGYASNFLLPRKLAKKVTAKNEKFYAEKAAKVQVAAQVVASKMGMLAERIKNLNLTIKERQHDDGKLYGSISADDIVTALKAKDITVNKKQVVFPKSIRTVGEHKVAIKLSAKLQPQATVKVVGTE